MKRTEQIAIRITPETKKALSTLARKKDWTIAHTANRLLEDSLGITNQEPGDLQRREISGDGRSPGAR